MVVSEHDLARIREEQNHSLDVKPECLAAAQALLATFSPEVLGPERDTRLPTAAMTFLDALSFAKDRSADDFAQDSLTTGKALDEVRLLGLSYEQHARAMALAGLCNAALGLHQSVSVVRDTGPEGAETLSPLLISARESVVQALKGAAEVFVKSVS